MVPVRKPGRPLSACPHGRDQQCTCGSKGVTAAIPRKQTCRCGHESLDTAAVPPQSNGASISEAPLPTRVAFKVQKNIARQSPSRRPSVDAHNLERMDINQLNVLGAGVHFPAPSPTVNGFGVPNALAYGYAASYAGMHMPAAAMLRHPLPLVNNDAGTGTAISTHSSANGEIEEATQADTASVPNVATSGSQHCCAPDPPPAMPSLSKSLNGSCCKAKVESPVVDSTAASTSLSKAPKGSCCTSKAEKPGAAEHSSSVTPAQSPHLSSQPQIAHFQPALPTPHFAHATMFAYPPTYGSYQHPLQPAEWRNGIKAMTYNAFPSSYVLPGSSLGVSDFATNMDTIHACVCGDGCQCIGCAAHPYNDATQDYVRSAWASANEIQTPRDSMDATTNGLDASPNEDGDNHQRYGGPLDSTATSPTSDEQSLAATDFFFVTYPFASDACGGDTHSCPCGDECECLGCTIHRIPEPSIAKLCDGAGTGCPCDNNCRCVGCSLHKPQSTTTEEERAP